MDVGLNKRHKDRHGAISHFSQRAAINKFFQRAVLATVLSTTPIQSMPIRSLPQNTQPKTVQAMHNWQNEAKIVNARCGTHFDGQSFETFSLGITEMISKNFVPVHSFIRAEVYYRCDPPAKNDPLVRYEQKMDFVPCFLSTDGRPGVKNTLDLYKVIACMDNMQSFKEFDVMRWFKANACPTYEEKAAYENEQERIRRHVKEKDRPRRMREVAIQAKKLLKPFDKLYDALQHTGIRNRPAAILTVIAFLSTVFLSVYGVYRIVRGGLRMMRKNKDERKERKTAGEIIQNRLEHKYADGKKKNGVEMGSAFKSRNSTKHSEAMEMAEIIEEPKWDDLYSKYDKKLVAMFQQFYELKKYFYYKIKCTDKIEDREILLKKSVEEAGRVFGKADEYARASGTMRAGLVLAVLPLVSKFGPNYRRYHPIIRKISKEEMEFRKKEHEKRENKWLMEISSNVSKKDFERMKELEKNYAEKYGGLA